ncbi:TAXI family TRAP transporter solute-binding subunit [Geosporobacter ferrireducens]|uniref:TAXI family TRAP transporter solute-binding subunit n=1 Tax=Geosporobacter ferrireducens TaxID=1424294 RepID=UPI00139D8AEE|nr:TAXI family TRAP transporter solute-binding subunit [Geosporobacter ferrireducens]MTI56611.1 TAXI family TRAP transporter solute-binding subunit [Geosporobacter ferrireducens]
MKTKQTIKTLCMVLIFSIVILSLAGCSPKDNSSVQSNGFEQGGEIDFDKKETVSIATGSSGGSYYMVGTALAEIIQKYDSNLICSSETTGGTSENIALVTSGETTFGMGMSDDIAAAYNGERDYEGAPADNLRAISSGQTAAFQIIVLASSDIYSLKDLKGKKVSLGPAGAPFFAPNLLESAVGLTKSDYNGQYLSHDQAADALNDGDVNAAIVATAYPTAAYANLAYTKDLRFISLSEEEMSKALAANPTWKTGLMPADIYNGQKENVTTPVIPVWLFTSADVGEDIIYRISKQIFEHTEELGRIAIDASYYNVDTAFDGVTIPIHPGAQRYIDEVKGK